MQKWTLLVFSSYQKHYSQVLNILPSFVCVHNDSVKVVRREKKLWDEASSAWVDDKSCVGEVIEEEYKVKWKKHDSIFHKFLAIVNPQLVMYGSKKLRYKWTASNDVWENCINLCRRKLMKSKMRCMGTIATPTEIPTHKMDKLL